MFFSIWAASCLGDPAVFAVFLQGFRVCILVSGSGSQGLGFSDLESRALNLRMILGSNRQRVQVHI